MSIERNSTALSADGISFVCGFEGFSAKPYQDSGGVWTIGFGTAISAAQAEQYKDGITEQMATQMMTGQLQGFALGLIKLELSTLMQNQFDACCSLAYNIGLTAFSNSTILKRIIARSTDLSPWGYWIKDAKGQVQEGLVRRRQAELKLFIYGLYQ